MKIMVPLADWELLKSLHADRPGDELLRAAFDRGAVHLVHENEETSIDSSPQEALTHLGAEVAIYRWLLVEGRQRLIDAEHQEKEAHRESVEIDGEVLPSLKEEARRLRVEIASLESRLIEDGRDPSQIEPAMPVDAIVVDGYTGPAYQEEAERSRAAVEFFRRIR